MKLNELLNDWLSEATPRWEKQGETIYFSEEEIECITECKIKCYNGDYGFFYKLYITLEFDGKKLQLTGDPSTDGKVYPGVKLDVTSEKRVSHLLEEGETIEIDPHRVRLYFNKNIETGVIYKRCRIRKEE
jgi:hypothetical protein